MENEITQEKKPAAAQTHLPKRKFPMKWHYFLIWFVMLNLVLGQLIEGVCYLSGFDVGMFYTIPRSSDALSTLNILYGIMMLIAAGFGVITILKLKKFARKGWLFAVLYFAAVALLADTCFTILVIMAHMAGPGGYQDRLITVIEWNFVYMVVDISLCLGNLSYYLKRKELFVK